MIAGTVLPIERLLSTMAIVVKEAGHLEWSRTRLFDQHIDSTWFYSLGTQTELAERLEAFVFPMDAFRTPWRTKLCHAGCWPWPNPMTICGSKPIFRLWDEVHSRLEIPVSRLPSV
jgi:hypothetical protein